MIHILLDVQLEAVARSAFTQLWLVLSFTPFLSWLKLATVTLYTIPLLIQQVRCAAMLKKCFKMSVEQVIGNTIPVLKDLHWLWISYQGQLKVPVFTNKTLNIFEDDYLRDHICHFNLAPGQRISFMPDKWIWTCLMLSGFHMNFTNISVYGYSWTIPYNCQIFLNPTLMLLC